MKLKRSKILAMGASVIMALALCLVAPLSTNAAVPTTPTGGLTSLIKGLTMTSFGSSEDLLVKEEPTRFGSSASLNIDLEYDPVAGPEINQGDTLSIQLVPVDEEKDFIWIPSVDSGVHNLVDDDVVVGKADMSTRLGTDLTFERIAAGFTVDIDMKFNLNNTAVREYFEAHEGETEVTFTYDLVVDCEKTGQRVSFITSKIEAVERQYTKTSGNYVQGSELGRGKFLYNIKIATELNNRNEFVVYDTPDVNQVYAGDLAVCIPKDYGKTGTAEFSQDSDGYVYIGDGDEDTRMEMYIYDIYFVTEESTSTSSPRQAGYEDVTLTYPDRVSEGWNGVAETTAAVPKNIILEKPAGEALTAEEQQLIDEAGGLNKTVGKGFKLRIKNFQSHHFAEGGYITLVYHTEIVNNSPAMNDKGQPVYVNTSSYYAQEVPYCTGGECSPIEHEKTELSAIIKGDNTEDATVDTGDIDVTVDKYQYGLVDFTKLGRTVEQADSDAEPLAGAVFTVYHANDDGTNGDIAETKDGVKLENLVTNAAGELCLAKIDGTAGEPVVLRLPRGNYFFVEVSAPKGYEQPEGDEAKTLVTVGLIASETDVVNVAEPEPAPEKVLPQAYGLVAYEGGLGSHGDPETGDALPEPVWRAQWEGWTVTVDGEPWDIDAKGMPFNWGYFAEGETDPADVITSAAGKGVYYLRAWPLDGDPEVIATDAQGKRYELGLDEGTTTAINDPGGAPVVMKVRDVTNDANAEGLATATFRPVYESEAEHAGRSLMSVLSGEGSATEGDFNENGTARGSCESSTEPHAHVAAGTAFYKNGNKHMPLNDDAKVSLLWDELQQGLLGGDEREGKLDVKARAAAGGVFASGENVEHEFKYMDLVDMEDGNVWVGTASEPTTVFWPYPEGVTAEDEIAVVRFPGLTRDYTIDADEEELDAAIESCDAEVLAIEKTDAGALFEVPSCGFGPFELMWTSADEGDEPGGDQPGGGDEENPDDQNPGGDDENPGGGDENTDNEKPGTNPGDNQPGSSSGTGTANGSGSGSGNGGKGSGSLPTTGDPVTLAAIAAATASTGALGVGSVLKRRKR